jgi:hypothetical protein
MCETQDQQCATAITVILVAARSAEIPFVATKTIATD